MSKRRPPELHDTSKAYKKLVTYIHNTNPVPLTDREAHEGARNLIGFCRTLLEIHTEMIQNRGHDKSD